MGVSAVPAMTATPALAGVPAAGNVSALHQARHRTPPTRTFTEPGTGLDRHG